MFEGILVVTVIADESSFVTVGFLFKHLAPIHRPRTHKPGQISRGSDGIC